MRSPSLEKSIEIIMTVYILTSSVTRLQRDMRVIIIFSVTDNHSELIMSKSRVALMKTRTWPELELTGIEMGTQLVKYLVETTTKDRPESKGISPF